MAIIKSQTTQALNNLASNLNPVVTLTKATHNQTRFAFTATGKYANKVMTASLNTAGKLTIRQDAIKLDARKKEHKPIYDAVATAIKTTDLKSLSTKRVATTTTTTTTYRQLQSELKAMRNAGVDVQVKLNAKTAILQAEYNRLKALPQVNKLVAVATVKPVAAVKTNKTRKPVVDLEFNAAKPGQYPYCTLFAYNMPEANLNQAA